MTDVIFYGAGSDLKKILSIIDCNEMGYKPVCVADRNISRAGKIIHGITVVRPEEIFDYNSDIIIITASFFDSIYADIVKLFEKKQKDISSYRILVAPYAWLMLVDVDYTESLLHDAKTFIQEKEADIKSLYDLSDRTTSEIIDFILKARKGNSYTFYDYPAIKGMQYIEGYFYNNELDGFGDFTFIDAGAYIGDTYKLMQNLYGKRMARYYAYEPSTENFETLKTSLANETGFECVLTNKALGCKNDTVFMGKSGGEFGVIDNSSDAPSEKVSVVRLDDEDISVSGKLVIKMDVEGAEMDILKGATQTIGKYRPIMAVCVYHKYKDIYELPKFIADMGLDYRFVLRSGIHTHLLALPKD